MENKKKLMRTRKYGNFLVAVLVIFTKFNIFKQRVTHFRQKYLIFSRACAVLLLIFRYNYTPKHQTLTLLSKFFFLLYCLPPWFYFDKKFRAPPCWIRACLYKYYLPRGWLPGSIVVTSTKFEIQNEKKTTSRMMSKVL